MGKINRYSIWVFCICLAVCVLSACVVKNGTDEPKKEIIQAEKPDIDTMKVLETLELYRAKRYEGIQEAMNAGVENAHKLILYGRKLGSISPDIGKLMYLQTFDVAYNDLSELPAALADLHYLQGFYANGNKLTTFPEQVILLPLLKSLDLSDNQITSIPVEIARMDQLSRLSMDQNLLTSIPVQLYELKKLSILELSGNGLGEIPAGISNLGKLKKLDLSQNQLVSIPREISTLSGHLEDLYLQGNQIPPGELEWLAKALPHTKIRY